MTALLMKQMDHLFTFLFGWMNLAPWLVGGLLAVICAREIILDKRYSLFIFGCGGYLGYATLTTMLHILIASDSGHIIPYIGLSLAFISCILGVYVVKVHLPDYSSSLHTIFASGAVLLCFCYLIASCPTPAAGWDAIDWYFDQAAQYLTVIQKSGGTASLAYGYIQPPTNTYIGVYTRADVLLSGVSYPSISPWNIAYLNLGIVMGGMAHLLTSEYKFAIVTSLITLTTPLLENHGLISGYAEIWLTQSVVVSAGLICVGISSKAPLLALIGIVVAATCLGIKNTGFLYFLAIFVSVLLTLALTDKKAMVALALILTVAAFIILLKIEIDLHFLGYRYAYAPRENWTTIHLGGRAWKVSQASLTLIIQNDLHAFFRNQSFSIAGISLLITTLFLTTKATKSHTQPNFQASFFLCCGAWMILLGLGFAQYVYEYSLQNALPNSDTGNSRLSLPAVMLMLLCMVSTFKRKVRPPDLATA